MNKKPAYIFVSGGVISGIGKGVTAAALGALLKSRGYKVTLIKCDAYLNVDAGTIRPQEHGEVFVTVDGMETDQDIGHYERFLNEDLMSVNYLTNGQIYQEIIRRERNLEYKGEDVEVALHVPLEIIRRIKLAQETTHAEIIIIEIGGTVGEYQNELFIETNKIMKYSQKENVIHVHVGYLPIPHHLGEMKSKPLQTSVRILNGSGIQPDFIIGRAEAEIDEPRKQRIEWFCNVDRGNVISNPDLPSIYELPLIFAHQKFDEKVLEKLGLPVHHSDLTLWKNLKEKIEKKKKEDIRIAVIGKYFGIGDYQLSDAYVSVVEAIKHAGWEAGIEINLSWIESEDFEGGKKKIQTLSAFDGIIVPGGWGERGVEGIIKGIEYARNNKIPYLGLCYGMELACVEFARHVLHLKGAHTTEVNKKTPYPIIDIMEEQKKNIRIGLFGGTLRKGNWETQLDITSQTFLLYKKYHWIKKGNSVLERHRHRYEFNNYFKEEFIKNGLCVVGINPKSQLVEVIELSKKIHPFFIGTQYHPELASRPFRPHPLFLGLVENALLYKREKNK